MSEWIAVKERMPENFKNVLCVSVVSHIAVIEIAYHVGDLPFEFDGWKSASSYLGSNVRMAGKVTHWMPLPALPEVQP